MEFLPLKKMNNRIDDDRTDSNTALFSGLLLKAELITKLTVIGFVSAIPDDVENTRYAEVAELVQVNSIGMWGDRLRRLLTGPTLLPDGVRTAQNQLIERNSPGSWQHEAVERLNQCRSCLNLPCPPVPRNVQLLQWFNDFASLRNDTRGHGAPAPAIIAEACPHLEYSLSLLEDNLDIFNMPWAYIHQNLSGKYRVAYWGVISDNFETLKRRDDIRLPNGVYLDSGELHHTELLASDIEATDIWIANGKFNDKSFEMLSYWTDDRRKESATPYLAPANALPPSETEGLRSLDSVGNIFTNLPPAPSRYIGRIDLESQLREHISTVDRHPVVTLTGYGGIGKTSLALIVIRRMMQEERFPYEVVIWFSARDVDLLPTGPKVVRPTGLSIKDFAQEYVRLIGSDINKLGWTSNEDYLANQLGANPDLPTLFVFDNFETVSSPASLYEWIDTHIRHPNKVLITSRQRTFKGDYPLQVSGMTEDECSQLIDDTSSTLNIKHLITDDYKQDVIEESAGHPYVIKILLGERARDPRSSNVRRIIARQDRVLDALFDRSFNRLGQAGQLIFLTLCSWKSSIPRVGLGAVILRPGNERIDVDSAINELLQMSLIEESWNENNETSSELTVPFAARLFGEQKIEVSPLRALIRSNSDLLQLFGAVRPTRTTTEPEVRVETLAKNAAKRIERGDKDIADILPILEYLAPSVSASWILLADLISEFGGSDREDRMLEYLMKYVERPDSRSYPAVDVWNRIADIHDKRGNLYETVDAIAQICSQDGVETEELSSAVNRINQHLRFNDTSDLRHDVKQILLQDVANAMQRRMESLSAVDCSRLGWLYMNIGDVNAAGDVATKGVAKGDDNGYCHRLLERINR